MQVAVVEIEIKLDGNKIIGDLAKCQKLKYRFLIENLLFSSAILNDTNTIFITVNGLNEPKGTLINGKLHRKLNNRFKINKFN